MLASITHDLAAHERGPYTLRARADLAGYSERWNFLGAATGGIARRTERTTDDRWCPTRVYRNRRNGVGRRGRRAIVRARLMHADVWKRDVLEVFSRQRGSTSERDFPRGRFLAFRRAYIYYMDDERSLPFCIATPRRRDTHSRFLRKKFRQKEVQVSSSQLSRDIARVPSKKNEKYRIPRDHSDK